MTVGIQELADCQFQNEVSSQLIEGSALNDFRVEATGWRNSASNQERFIYLLKQSCLGWNLRLVRIPIRSSPMLHSKKAS